MATIAEVFGNPIVMGRKYNLRLHAGPLHLTVAYVYFQFCQGNYASADVYLSLGAVGMAMKYFNSGDAPVLRAAYWLEMSRNGNSFTCVVDCEDTTAFGVAAETATSLTLNPDAHSDVDVQATWSGPNTNFAVTGYWPITLHASLVPA